MYLVQGHTAKDMDSVYKCLLQNSPFFLLLLFFYHGANTNSPI